MKLGVITDVHNNLSALKAVLQKFDELQCEQLICCGDMISIGPLPEETVQAMIRLPCLTVVCGNHERYLTEGIPLTMEAGEAEHHRWEHSVLSEFSKAWIKTIAHRAELTCEGVRIAVMHYAMDAEGRYLPFVPAPTEEQLNAMFANVDADVILYGHDHLRHIVCGKRIYVNAGSLGCPGETRKIARACVLTIENGRVDVQPLDVAYDVEETLRAMNELDYPEAKNIQKFFYGVG